MTSAVEEALSRGSPTRALAANTMSVSYGDLPGDVLTVAKQCVLDVVGVTVAGAAEAAVGIVRETLRAESAPGHATLLGGSGTLSPVAAAAVNGTAAHALDYDDVSASMGGHPSVPVFPAVLALAEQHRLSGRALLAAFVAGYEAECRIGAAIGTGHYERGFHTTATAGTFGAAMASAHLLGLEAGQAETALGIAATHAAGLKSMFGTMCKPLHAGKAAGQGLLAAQLAGKGMTSASDALACPQGFAATQTDTFNAGQVTSPVGAPWHILDTLFKLHAACYLTHACIEAALELRQDAAVDPEGVDGIELRVPPTHLSVCDIAEPRTGLEGKFSLRFAAALALATGATGENQFTDQAIADPRLTELCARTTVTTDESLPRYGGVVTVTADGHTRRAEADTGSRRWVNEPREQTGQLSRKFHALASPILGATKAAALADAVWRLDELDDLTELTALAVPTPKAAAREEAVR